MIADYSVTKIINNVQQPQGGLLPISSFIEKEYGGEPLICKAKPLYVGKTVDALFHIIMYSDLNIIFRSSINGYNERVNWFANMYNVSREEIIKSDASNSVYAMLRRLIIYCGIENNFKIIDTTYRLVQYAEWEYDFASMSHFKGINDYPYGISKSDADNMTIMLERICKWSKLRSNNKVYTDLKFYPNGYTDNVKYGVGDLYTDTGLFFDIKCTKNKPTNINTLQILTYYCMAVHSDNKLYSNMKMLGLFSPITNTEWTIDIKDIQKESIEFVNKEVLKYEEIS